MSDELIRAVCLPRNFTGYISYSRKVGARNAQAISKVCIAALARLANSVVEDVRIAVGSVAPMPLRLHETERLMTGRPVDAVLVQSARRVAAAEVRPIDDIRSTAAYRSAVLANLVEEFLNKLSSGGPISHVLARWNQLPAENAAEEILPCCGSQAWARLLSSRRPFRDANSLTAASDEVWSHLTPADWMEAFSRHPRIGERKAPSVASPQSAAWSAQEQQNASSSPEAIQSALTEANRKYEQRFGRVFIVCATGKSAAEILDILDRRLHNDEVTEFREAAEEQRKITNIRLEKWLSQ
jgi:2-oxo-4-hydroxy-4-carboxy-5-ureidoimidazoline decarboxylase